jgi:subtilisin family serine protease
MKAMINRRTSRRLGQHIQTEGTSTRRKTITCRATIASLAILCFLPAAQASVHTITVGNEELRFVSQSERGYVVKLAKRTRGIVASGDVLPLDSGCTKVIRGADQQDLHMVENTGPATLNERAITTLSQQGRAAFAAPLFSSNGETVAIIPEIVVRMKLGTDMEQLQALCKKADCRISKRMEFTEQEYLLDVQGPDAEAVFAALEMFNHCAQVEWAAPNTVFQPKISGPAVMGDFSSTQPLRIAATGQPADSPGVIPNDQYFPLQWHLYNTGQSGGTPGADIRAPEAWEITTGDPNIVVAVLDCGVDTRHPDLVNNLVAGYDFYEDDPFPDPIYTSPADAHGTMCAGLVAAQGNNSIGVTGVTWNCKVMPIRQAQGQARAASEAGGATALRWAAAHGADIMSQSGGTDYPTPIIHSAIVDITKPGGIGRKGKGCVLVYAVHNYNSFVRYPARYPEVIAVGATDNMDVRWGYSCYGPELDIMAPGGPYPPGSGGVGIWTTDIVGSSGADGYNGMPGVTDYTIFGGTSASTPIVAGVAALILSIEPNLTSDEVRHFLTRSAHDLGDPGRDDYYGWGRVDARAALDMVLAKRADLNNDWVVDENDLAILTAAMKTGDLAADIAPAAKRDGIVDAKDRTLLMQYLGTELPKMPEPGLAAHWRLDEAEGMIAHEDVGQKDGTVVGAPIWWPEGGKVGGALELSGAANFVTVDLVRDPSQGPLSVFAWVKGGAPGQVILSQQGGADWLMAAPDGGLKTNLKDSSRQSKSLAAPALIADGAWHRVGLVWDGSNRILYVDDIEVAKDTQGKLASLGTGLYIGAGATLAPGSFWKGMIDDVRIYDRAVAP